jgi:hypothetical protein
MADLEFDREAVGVNAKRDWKDSEEFSGIARFVGTMSVTDAAPVLPTGDNSGTQALRSALTEMTRTMRVVIAEYSDACAVLGSGQELAIGDFDTTEYQNTESYRRLVNRMEDEE